MKMRLEYGCLKIILEAEKYEPESMFQILKRYPRKRVELYRMTLGGLYRHLKKKTTEDCPIDIYQGEAMIFLDILMTSRDLTEDQSKLQLELITLIKKCGTKIRLNDGNWKWR